MFPRQLSIMVLVRKRKLGVDEREAHCYWNKTFSQPNRVCIKTCLTSPPRPLSIVDSKVFCYMILSIGFNISKNKQNKMQPEQVSSTVSHTNRGLKLKLCNWISMIINISRTSSSCTVPCGRSRIQWLRTLNYNNTTGLIEARITKLYIITLTPETWTALLSSCFVWLYAFHYI